MININTIKAELARKNMTQKDLAKELKISISTVSMKMNSRLDFTIKEIVKISEVLHINLTDLIQ